MLTTGVGAEIQEDAAYKLVLPGTCTVSAFEALVHRVTTESDVIKVCWNGSFEDACALLHTADFLLLENLIPELVKVCGDQVRAPADIRYLMSLTIHHASLQELVDALAPPAPDSLMVNFTSALAA